MVICKNYFCKAAYKDEKTAPIGVGAASLKGGGMSKGEMDGAFLLQANYNTLYLMLSSKTRSNYERRTIRPCQHR